ncbi:MAG: DeoR/GlpR family DNA-binding transcription regulator [Desulfitobacteriaceae bacterium]
MLAKNRRRKITELLDESGSVRVGELSTLFEVTEETIRRDLEQLERDGYLTRTHGGASKKAFDQQEVAFYIRNMWNHQEKNRLSENVLASYNIKKAFVSCKGLTIEEGITESTDVQAWIKEHLIKGVKEVFMLADHDKFGKAALATVAPVNVINKIITDNGSTEEELNRFRSVGIEVVIA